MEMLKAWFNLFYQKMKMMYQRAFGVCTCVVHSCEKKVQKSNFFRWWR